MRLAGRTLNRLYALETERQRGDGLKIQLPIWRRTRVLRKIKRRRKSKKSFDWRDYKMLKG